MITYPSIINTYSKPRCISIHLKELIDYVYTEYPEYAENSELY